jgi:hypothetical protein
MMGQFEVPILTSIGNALMYSRNLLLEFQPVIASLAFFLESTGTIRAYLTWNKSGISRDQRTFTKPS